MTGVQTCALPICSHFGELSIHGVKIEIMGDVQKRSEDGSWEKPVELDEHNRFVEFRGMTLPVLTLEYEYEAYMKLGRFEQAKKLKDAFECRGDSALPRPSPEG